ncbi:ferredoxin--NADP reductase [Neptunicella sp. SCSIO 80796]|uniref:ferredoxin--NADP reductase n=1 Tax=Neptunicella plasticusilytica TaxID=3117012 RepID=UPI003A4DCAAD
MANWHIAEVISNHFWTDKLFSLKVRCPAEKFTAGQFVRLALQVGDKRVQRAYSLVNPPGSDYAEFYLTYVDDGLLSPALAALTSGDQIEVSYPASGFFTLDEVPDGDNLWLLATGTGVGPYLSMLATQEPWQRFKHIILVHAARWANELSYTQLIGQWQQQYAGQFSYVPVVSRESVPDALYGRIPALITDQQLQQQSEQKLDSHSQVMICGNPDMIKDTKALLETLGLEKNLRRKPGNVTVEQYW